MTICPVPAFQAAAPASWNRNGVTEADGDQLVLRLRLQEDPTDSRVGQHTPPLVGERSQRLTELGLRQRFELPDAEAPGERRAGGGGGRPPEVGQPRQVDRDGQSPPAPLPRRVGGRDRRVERVAERGEEPGECGGFAHVLDLVETQEHEPTVRVLGVRLDRGELAQPGQQLGQRHVGGRPSGHPAKADATAAREPDLLHPLEQPPEPGPTRASRSCAWTTSASASASSVSASSPTGTRTRRTTQGLSRRRCPSRRTRGPERG